jgi:hypothetical protein
MADPIQRLQSDIQQQVADIGGIVDSVVNRLKGVLGDAISGVFTPVAAALQGALDLIAQLVGGLLGDLVTIPDAVRSGYEEWLKMAGEDNGPSTAMTRWIIHNFGAGADKALQDKVGEQNDTLIGWLLGDRVEKPSVGHMFEGFKSKPGWYQGIVYLAATVASTGALLQGLQQPELSALQQSALMEDPTSPLTLAQLASATVQSQVGEDFAAEQAKRLGITPELFQIVVNTTGNPLAPEQMLELWRRGVVDEPTVDQAIRESALKNKYIDAFKALRFVLPSPSDLIRFLVRDAFDDTVAADLQTDTDFDKKFDPDLFFKVGVDPDDARRFWRAHWQLPSPTQLFEMHHRTSNAPSYQSEPIGLPSGATVHRLISAEFLQRTLQINDLLPPFLDKYTAISFNPVTRIDARRLYLADVFSDDDLYRAFLDEGYAPELAGRMLQWQQQAKAKAQKDEALKHAAPIIAHLRSMYANGSLDSADATGQLVELGADPDIVAMWLRADDLDRERRRASAIRDDLHRLYVAEFLTEDDVDSRLGSEGFTGAERARLLDDWRLDLQLKAESDDQKRARELTKSHVLDAYKDRRISRDEAESMLLGMGYHQDQSDFWLQDVDFDAAQKDADTVREAVHADFVDGVIDFGTALSQLDALGVQSGHRDALLRRWSTERRRKEPRLSIGEVTQLAEKQIIPPDQLVDYLRRLRYQDREIELLQALWGYDIGVKAEQVALAQAKFEEQKRQFEQRRQDAAAREERARAERESARQAAESQRIAAEQRRADAQAQAEARRAQAQLEAENRRSAAEAARHERNVAEAQAREERARQERDQARAQRAQIAEQARAATDARQQRTFAQQDRTLAQREAFTEQRFQAAQQARIEAEQRHEQSQIERENRQEQARIRAESRSQEAKIATENRGERRTLERELRQQGFAEAREQRAQAARVAQEQRAAEARATVASAQAQAQLQIQQLRDDERRRLENAAATRAQRIADAAQRRISALS